jgi:thioredoxin-related protein
MNQVRCLYCRKFYKNAKDNNRCLDCDKQFDNIVITITQKTPALMKRLAQG